MTDYSPTGSQTNAGATVTKRTGTASSDRIYSGCNVLFLNGGAGSHVITFTNAGLSQGLPVGNRTLTVPAAGAAVIYMQPDWAASDGFIPVAIDGTPTEVTYYPMGV